MTVAELLYGRGTPTPLHEVARDWPLFWAYRQRQQQRQAFKAEQERQRR